MLDQSLDSSNNTNISTNHNMPGWSTAQKMTMDVQHSSRNDKYAELAYQNAVNQQNLSNHSSLDELNANRSMNRLVYGALAEKFINLGTDDAIANSELIKGGANGSILSVLSQLSGGQIGTKTAQSTPPESGVTQQMAQLNALNAQNGQNQAASTTLAATLVALAGISAKGMYNVPPVGSTPIEQPVQRQV